MSDCTFYNFINVLEQIYGYLSKFSIIPYLCLCDHITAVYAQIFLFYFDITKKLIATNVNNVVIISLLLTSYFIYVNIKKNNFILVIFTLQTINDKDKVNATNVYYYSVVIVCF